MCDFGMVGIRFSKGSHLPQAKLIWEFLSRWGVCKQVSKHIHTNKPRGGLKKPLKTQSHTGAPHSLSTLPLTPNIAHTSSNTQMY